MTGRTFEQLFREKMGIAEDEVIQEIEVFLERSVRAGIKDGDIVLDPADKHHLAKLDVLAEAKADEDPDPLPKPKRKYTRRAPVAVLPKKKKGKPGRKYSFDMEITTTRVGEAKEYLQKLLQKGKLEELEIDRYTNLCDGVNVEELTAGKRDWIINLYKDVGRRLTGGE